MICKAFSRADGGATWWVILEAISRADDGTTWWVILEAFSRADGGATWWVILEAFSRADGVTTWWVIKAERAIASEALVAQNGRQPDVCGGLWTRTCLAQSA